MEQLLNQEAISLCKQFYLEPISFLKATHGGFTNDSTGVLEGSQREFGRGPTRIIFSNLLDSIKSSMRIMQSFFSLFGIL